MIQGAREQKSSNEVYLTCRKSLSSETGWKEEGLGDNSEIWGGEGGNGEGRKGEGGGSQDPSGL